MSSYAQTRPLPRRALFRRGLLLAIAAFLFWAAAFGVAFGQWPLYSENQDTKFLHGLAQHGLGSLREDWLAQTIDPLPAFSFLVDVTCRLFPPAAFYAYHVLLLGVYLFGLTGIAGHLYPSLGARSGRIVLSTLLITLHSTLLPPFTWKVYGVSLGWLLQSGVANQYLLNPVFQPSTFGVLLVLSLYLFLRGRPVWAAAVAASAAVLHSTYMPAAAILTASYAGIKLWDERRASRSWMVALRSSLWIGLAALALVAPVLVYNAVVLGPTSAEAWARAQEIIVRYRIPHHSLPDIWIDATVYVKVGLVLVALLLQRRTRLFPILLLSSIAAVALTWVEIETGNNTLALVAPWRISVLLVPLATTLILAATLAALLSRVRVPAVNGALVAGSLALLAVLAYRGAVGMRSSFAERARAPQTALQSYVAHTKTSGEVYLIPTSMPGFRLAAGAPVVVTWKSHPYKDVEVIAWQQRVEAVNDFYAAPTCEKLQALAQRYGVTHVVFEGPPPLECRSALLAYRDDHYTLLRLVSTPR